MKLIPLTQGYSTMVDDEDFEWLSQWKWYAHKDHKSNNFYVRRHLSLKLGKNKIISMHRVILNPSSEKQVDHIDGNGLNNQKANLRICMPSQNRMNRARNENNTSGFKGVVWHMRYKKWQSCIGVDRKLIYLGCFTDKTEAAKTYDTAALKYHGEFARLNFPLEVSYEYGTKCE